MSEPTGTDTPAQKNACAIMFEGEFQDLRTALRGLGDHQPTVTELAVLLLIYDLPVSLRGRVATTVLSAFVKGH